MKGIKAKKGFTLIELLVSVGIFIIVVSVVLSLFLSTLSGYRKSLAIQDVQDNARYILGFMGKELRMSEINSATYNQLSITRHDGQDVTYVFDGGKIIRQVSGNPYESGPINAENVSINGQFHADGVGTGDQQQPTVTIMMDIETTGPKQRQAQLSIQTTLCPRKLDIRTD